MRLSSRAEKDLLEIWEFIAQDNPVAADDLMDEVERLWEKLADSPFSGRLRDDLSPNLRSWSLGDYVIFYYPDEEGPLIARVLHGARDLSGLF